ncbi:MAG: pilus assembly protein [Paracoccaceae bacterium]|jgi:Flp pilus assembly pilin Flp
MKFFKLAKKFHEAEDGAVTVDWVVLTAAVVGLGIAALAAVKGGMKTLTTNINNQLSSQSINTTFN